MSGPVGAASRERSLTRCRAVYCGRVSIQRLIHRRLRLLQLGHSTLVPDPGPLLTTKSGSVFALCAVDGDIDGRVSESHGLYFHDTRFLDRSTLTMEGQRLSVLLADAAQGDRSVCELTNPDLLLENGRQLRREQIGLRRERILNAEVLEQLTVQSFASTDLELSIELVVAADFVDMFQVRGSEPGRRGRLRRPTWNGAVLSFRYDGADRRVRTTRVTFDPPPHEHTGTGRLSYRLQLPRGGQETLRMTVTLGDEGDGALEDRPAAMRGHRTLRSTAVKTSNPLFDRVLDRSFSDLRMLMTTERGDTYFAAGVPWFVALFGRDSLITALLSLPFDARIAATTLELLARYQGQVEDGARGEQPGKILHELRIGEMANLGEIPQTPYYGSVDATPLFLILLADYVRWTADLELWEGLRDNAERALAWIDTYGDSDGDGFYDYESRSPRGLANQGWKDSGNSIAHPDGTLATPPIALVEVQGCVHRAWLGMAWLYRHVGLPERAQDLEAKAASLRRRFVRAYWMPQRRYLALALERGGGQVATITSNPGQALWSGIVEDRHAGEIAARLTGPRLYSGWGVRTLAEGQDCFNPIDYQVGAVWPHDNALIAAGLKRYGRDQGALQILTGMFEAAVHFENNRLPELFAGFARSRYRVPVRYPVACSPQAWSSATMPSLLITCLGVEADATRGRLILRRPALPEWLDQVELTDLAVGRAHLALRFTRDGEGVRTEVIQRRGTVEVEELS